MCVYDEHLLAGRDIQSVNNLLSTCVLLPKECYNTLGILLTILGEYYLQYEQGFQVSVIQIPTVYTEQNKYSKFIEKYQGLSKYYSIIKIILKLQ